MGKIKKCRKKNFDKFVKPKKNRQNQKVSWKNFWHFSKFIFKKLKIKNCFKCKKNRQDLKFYFKKANTQKTKEKQSKKGVVKFGAKVGTFKNFKIKNFQELSVKK